MYRCCVLFRVLVLVLLLVFTGLGFAGDMLYNRHNNTYYVSLWGARNRRGYYFSLSEVSDVCPTVGAYLATVMSFAFMWSALLCALLALTLLELCCFGYRRIFDIIFFFLNFPALAFGLITWANGLALLYGDNCPSANISGGTVAPTTTPPPPATLPKPTAAPGKGILFFRSPLYDDQMRVGVGLALFITAWGVQIIFLTCAKCASNKAYFVSPEGKAAEGREIAAERARREERMRRINTGELKEA